MKKRDKTINGLLKSAVEKVEGTVGRAWADCAAGDRRAADGERRAWRRDWERALHAAASSARADHRTHRRSGDPCNPHPFRRAEGSADRLASEGSYVSPSASDYRTKLEPLLFLIEESRLKRRSLEPTAWAACENAALRRL